MIGKLILALACTIFAAPASAATLRAQVSPSSTTENQSIQLRLEVVGPLSMVVYDPEFSAADFIRVGSPGHSSPRHSSSEKTLNYTFILSPKRTGNLRLSNIRVRTNMGVLTAPDLTVAVREDRSASAPAYAADDDDDSTNPASPSYRGPSPDTAREESGEYPTRFNSDFTVFASLSKRSAYVGEPIVVEYWLYDFGALRQIEVQKWPTFNGYWKEDLEIARDFRLEPVIAGDRMGRRAFIGRYALYGIKPGRLSLDKLTIRAQYAESLMGNPSMVFGIRVGTHSSQDENITILPLPTEGRPGDYGGAVGNFSLKLEADKTQLLQHTPVTFTATIRGIGNFQAIDSLRLPLPPDFEVHDEATNARGATPIGVRRELETSKTFRFTAIPRKAGSFRVEPLRWTYFDPDRKAYVTLATEAIDIQVGENAAGAQDKNSYLKQPGATGSGGVQANVVRPLKSSIASKDLWPWMVPAAWLALLTNLALMGWLLKRRAGGFYKKIMIDGYGGARAELKEAAASRDWVNPLENGMYLALAVPLGHSPRGLTRQDFRAAWVEQGLPAPVAERANRLLDRLDQQRFSAARVSPAEANRARQELLAESYEILRQCMKLKRR